MSSVCQNILNVPVLSVAEFLSIIEKQYALFFNFASEPQQQAHPPQLPAG